jgi:putative sterol carrier protein
MTEASEAAAQVDLSSLDPSEVATMIGQVSDEQLDEVMKSAQREQALAEVFRRMGEHFRPSAAAQDAIIHWKITGGPDGSEDDWTAKIEGDKCTTTQGLEGEPRVTFTMSGPTFMKLVTGNAAGPMLFISGKLKISGDIPFAAQIQSLFEIPS